MLTQPQILIIKDVCSIQFKSLEDIIMKIDLGSVDDEPYEQILSDLGCTRKDFDEELINTYNNFRIVFEDPESIYNLNELDMTIFKHILHKWEHKWVGNYPKALSNLWNKLFLVSAINELRYGPSKN